MLATASLRNNGVKLINGMKLWRNPIATINRSDAFSSLWDVDASKRETDILPHGKAKSFFA